MLNDSKEVLHFTNGKTLLFINVIRLNKKFLNSIKNKDKLI